jgi:hypothetical protein
MNGLPHKFIPAFPEELAAKRRKKRKKIIAQEAAAGFASNLPPDTTELNSGKFIPLPPGHFAPFAPFCGYCPQNWK